MCVKNQLSISLTLFPDDGRCFSKFEGEGEGKGGEMAMAGRHVHVISHEMGC